MIFSVKLLEKNEGIFENELPGKIVCMGLAFTVAFFWSVHLDMQQTKTI